MNLLYELPTSSLIIFILSAMLIGMAKVGVAGVGMLVVPLLASVFGGKESTGVLLPLLIMADILAIIYYHRHAQWKYILKLFPLVVAGVLIAVFTGDHIDEYLFSKLLAGVVIFGALMLLLMELKKDLLKNIPHHPLFWSTTGILGGFTTMIGNAAGPIMNVYLLSINLDKNKFIGTKAWFFFLVNVFKVPFHILVWQTINTKVIVQDLFMLPFIGIGAVIGIWVVKQFPEKQYRYFIIVTTLIAAFKVLT